MNILNPPEPDADTQSLSKWLFYTVLLGLVGASWQLGQRYIAGNATRVIEWAVGMLVGAVNQGTNSGSSGGSGGNDWGGW